MRKTITPYILAMLCAMVLSAGWSQSQETAESDTTVLTLVEEPAEPIGGYAAFYRFVAQNMRYPAAARRSGVTGKVFAQFVIIEDGSISDIKIVKGIGYGCDEEVIRILESAPKWNPPRQAGVAVKQRIVMPINFNIVMGKSTSLNLKSAVFPGGNEKIPSYIKDNQQQVNQVLPINESQNSVILKFKVNNTGKVVDVEVTSSLGEAFDQEAIRLFQEMPLWQPATRNKEPITENLTGFVRFGSVKQAHIESSINLISSANYYFNTENYKKAASQYTKAIAKNPFNLEGYYLRGNAYFMMNQVENGCADLKVIKDLNESAGNDYGEKCEM